MTFNFRIGWGVQNSSIRLFGLQPGGLQLNPTAESHQVQGFGPIQCKNFVHPLHSYIRGPWKWKCPENTLVDWWKRIKSLFMKGNCYHVHFLEKMGTCTQISMTIIVEFKGAKLVGKLQELS